MPTATLNGFAHYYEDAGGGPLLVMLHGAGSSSVSLQSHIDDLAKDFRVVAPDLRAMGRSEHVAELPPPAWVDDLSALLDYLEAPPPLLYGVSLGSRVALRFAIDHPERVRGLILDGPIIAQDQAGNTATAQVFNVESYSEERKADMRRLHGDEWETVARNYLSIRNRPELQEFYNLRAAFPSVRCPVLITRGDRDDANHKLAYTYELKQGMADARLAIAPGIGFSMAAGRPEGFRALFREFAAAC